MSKKRRQYSAKYKFQVALEAAKGQKTISELASEYSIHPNQIRNWKRQLMEGPTFLDETTATVAKNKPPRKQSSMSRSAGSKWNWSG